MTQDTAQVQYKSLFKRNPQSFVSILARRIVKSTRGMANGSYIQKAAHEITSWGQ